MNAKRKATLAGAVITGGAIMAFVFFRGDQRTRPSGTSERGAGDYHPVPPAGASHVGVRMAGTDQTPPRGIAPEPDASESERAIQSWVNTIPAEDLAAEVATLTSAEQSELAHDLWLRLLRRWAEIDPEAAADWASGIANDGSSLTAEALNQVAIAWANRDLWHAVEWVSQWPEGSQRERGLLAVAYEGARKNPVAAVQMASDMPSTQETWNLIGYAVSQWATIDPAAATQWARRIEDLATRETLLSNVAVSWAASDPLQASGVLQELSAGRPQDDAVVGIAQHWAQIDLRAAKEWLEQSACSSDARASALQAMSAIHQHIHGK